MADQCIVCLEDLDVVPGAIHDGMLDAESVAATSSELATTHPRKQDNEQPIALIKPCGHVLHDECLREWSQKANSCPICRHAFNLVEVLDKVGGKYSRIPPFPSRTHAICLAEVRWHSESVELVKRLRVPISVHFNPRTLPNNESWC